MLDELDGIPAYSIVAGPDGLVGLGVKQAFDTVSALVGLILFSPVMAVVALAIRSRDGRPIVFTQGAGGPARAPAPFGEVPPDGA